MRFFKKAKSKDGWLAMMSQRDGVAAVRISRAAERPALVLATKIGGDTPAAALEAASKELRASYFRCTTLLAGGQYQILAVEAPNVPQEEMRTAVRWKLKDMLDFPVDEATIDVLEIPIDKNSPVRPQQTVFVVAARNSVIAPLQKSFADAKASLSAIDIPEMAQRNIAAMIEPEGRGLAMLSFDEDGGLLTVTYGGELYLSRRIDVPLAQMLDDDHDRKIQCFDRIVLELQRSLDNFERQFSFISVARLVLAPSVVAGLDEYLSSNLYTPVESLDLGSVIDLSQVPALAELAVQQKFFLAIGAALRQEEKRA